ncbi:MAG TPA: DUF6064 family protein [bacterium]|jgi:hypothetical protein
MSLPFTVEQFLAVFAGYNQAVWPAQILLNAAALAAIFLAIRPGGQRGRIISALLGLLWIWMGVVYHWIYFSGINRAAYLFGALFVVQGLLILYSGVFRGQLTFSLRKGCPGIRGSMLMTYSLVVYPILGYFLGHVYPSAPTFGLPCPTTIFSLGLLLWVDPKPPKLLLVIPLLWVLVGSTAAFSMGIWEDLGLLAAAALTLAPMLPDKGTSTASNPVH